MFLEWKEIACNSNSIDAISANIQSNQSISNMGIEFLSLAFTSRGVQKTSIELNFLQN